MAAIHAGTAAGVDHAVIVRIGWLRANLRGSSSLKSPGNVARGCDEKHQLTCDRDRSPQGRRLAARRGLVRITRARPEGSLTNVHAEPVADADTLIARGDASGFGVICNYINRTV